MNRSNRKRILLSNIAHMGDVILGTSMLPVLKSAFDEIEIGFLVSQNGAKVLEGHKLVDHIHVFNHPRHNRDNCSFKEKRKIGAISYIKALKDIQKLNYDVAIDQYSIFYSSSKALLFNSDIPLRIGWTSFNNPYYFNHLIDLPNPSWHIVKRYEVLLKSCLIDEKHLPLLMPNLDYNLSNFEFRKILSNPKKTYLLIHMGTGDKKREWDIQNWIKLCQSLETEGHTLVFTGYGSREKERISTVRSFLKSSVDLCSKLFFKELVEVVKNSKLVISLETMVVHIASAFNAPTVAIYGGYYRVERWRPYHENSYVLTPPKQYFNDYTLAPRTAINLITHQDVLKKIKEVLNR